MVESEGGSVIKEPLDNQLRMQIADLCGDFDKLMASGTLPQHE
jgi:hypothetical protein